MKYFNSGLSLSSIITGFPEPILNNTFKPIILISGNYNAFEMGFDAKGSYMCSGLYQSSWLKLPIYIGGSDTIQFRIEKQHIPQLNNEKHSNSVFEKSWNDHKNDGFVWWLLEESLNEESWITEQKWLNYYRPFVKEKGGFNISENTLAPMKGRKQSEEAKRKNSETHKKLYENGLTPPMLGKNHTPEVCEKISNLKKGKMSGKNNPNFGNKWTEEEKNNSKKTWKEKYENGYKNPMQGKSMPKDSILKNKESPSYDHNIYKFKNLITNEIFEGTQYEFKIKYNLKQTSICALLKGRLKTIKNWTLNGNSSEYLKTVIKNQNIYTFKNIITNEIFQGTVRDFIKKYNLQKNNGSMYSLSKGKIKVSKNWILLKNDN